MAPAPPYIPPPISAVDRNKNSGWTKYLIETIRGKSFRKFNF
jgi:hypothetical protein